MHFRSTEKHSLFQQLKSVVQRILSQHSWNVWSVHGGMEHLIQALDSIFQHGLKPHAVSDLILLPIIFTFQSSGQQFALLITVFCGVSHRLNEKVSTNAIARSTGPCCLHCNA